MQEVKTDFLRWHVHPFWTPKGQKKSLKNEDAPYGGSFTLPHVSLLPIAALDTEIYYPESCSLPQVFIEPCNVSIEPKWQKAENGQILLSQGMKHDATGNK